jgi:hypothetical protein
MMHRLGHALVLGASLAAAMRAQQVNEYQMKAAYLYNFAKFVEWPSQTFKNDSDPIMICVLGQEPLFRTLQEAVNGEKIEDRELIVREVSDVQQMSVCHILFIGSSDLKYLRSVLRDLKITGILTVGEADGFTSEGGVANFKKEANKIRIEINIKAAERQKLRISPNLLNLALIVKK